MGRITGLALVLACLAAGSATAADKPAPAKKHIRMNDPMATGMMKPGMTKGEVKSAAERKTREMQPAMEREQQSMPPAKP